MNAPQPAVGRRQLLTRLFKPQEKLIDLRHSIVADGSSGPRGFISTLFPCDRRINATSPLEESLLQHGGSGFVSDPSCCQIQIQIVDGRECEIKILFSFVSRLY